MDGDILSKAAISESLRPLSQVTAKSCGPPKKFLCYRSQSMICQKGNRERRRSRRRFSLLDASWQLEFLLDKAYGLSELEVRNLNGGESTLN